MWRIVLVLRELTFLFSQQSLALFNSLGGRGERGAIALYRSCLCSRYRSIVVVIRSRYFPFVVECLVACKVSLRLGAVRLCLLECSCGVVIIMFRRCQRGFGVYDLVFLCADIG